VHTRQAEALPRMPSLEEHTAGPAGSRQALDFVEQSITLQLELLRTSLELNTAVVLWHNRDLAELHLRGISTVRDDVRQGPFAPGVGIPATILREEVREMQVAPVRAGLAMLPYYSEGAPVGGLFAVAIPHRVGATDVQDTGVDGVLCVDRERTERFTDAERTVVRQTARKIAMDVACGRVLKQSEHDRATMSRFVVVLRELNAQLGLEGVARAASKAVKTLFSVDLVAVSELEGDILRIIHADGINADRFQGLQFTRDEGLTGQAVSKRVVLPHGGEYRGVQPIFTASDRLGDLHSLLVIPLCPPDGDPDVPVVGALTVGSREANLFSPQQQKVLELIATTLATKLDLARSHEKLRDLATHDGLTSLALRRVFDERIESMLQRAERTEGRMALMLMDIDKFKPLNDNYGHPFGDEVLKGQSPLSCETPCARSTSPRATAAKSLPSSSKAPIARVAACSPNASAPRSRRSSFAMRPKVKCAPAYRSGVAAFPDDGREKQALISHADLALYYAKAEGRNQVKAFADLPPGAEMPEKQDAAAS
jgi:hypothetical protein